MTINIREDIRNKSEAKDARKAMIFIPDITGYTKFVTETESTHSRHIISELLETLIDENELDMEVSEIEGDAILFYRFGEAPSLNEILSQCERMFNSFHWLRKLYERDRLCQCGACSDANELTLKFIVHYGNVDLMRVKEHKKLFGTDVLIAHRLLKNDIQETEYLLLSEEFLKQVKNKDDSPIPDWFHLSGDSMEYQDIGTVKFSYQSLTPLLYDLNELPLENELHNSQNPVIISLDVNASLMTVYNVLINIDLKPEWTFGLLNVVKNDNHLPRVGSEHQCIMPAGVLHITTAGKTISAGHIEYGELVKNIPLFKDLFVVVVLDEKQDSTQVQFQLHYNNIRFIPRIRRFIANTLLKFMFCISAKRFAKLCEQGVYARMA